MDGIEATKQIRKEFPGLGIIAFSMFDEDNLIVDMLEAGAKGYLLKNAQKEEIIAAIKTVNKGEPYYCRETTHKLAEMIANSNFNQGKKNAVPDLSEREISIIRLICEEYSNKEIAEMLDLSKRTIEDYREKILEKIDAKNSAGIVVFAIRNKIF
jgi:DNA-binding NarL/FixJ family response regulator